MAISARLSECVRQVTLVDDSILHFRLGHTYGLMTVVAVYALPEEYELRDKELFNHKLDSVVGRYLAVDVLVVLGDLNAETESNRAWYESILVPKALEPGTRTASFSSILQNQEYS